MRTPPEMTVRGKHAPARKDVCVSAGLMLLVGAAYVMLSPGRIDIIDGQWRFEVAYNLVREFSLAVKDSGISGWGLPGADGNRYSVYGVSGSIVALPLVWLADVLAPDNRDVAQFLFSFTSSVLSAVTLGLLYLAYRQFGISRIAAVGWTLVFGFATLFLPLATSVFDQTQNALFLLIAFLCADASRDGTRPTLAIVGALAFAFLINFKEAYIVLWPGLLWTAGLAKPGDFARKLRAGGAVTAYFAGGVLGLAILAILNLARFRHLLPPAPSGYHPPLLGNPLLGLATISVSPGKGIIWYSPALLLALLGWRKFLSHYHFLATGILISCAVWLTLVASLSFAAGDWCWGPRYWIPIAPLLFLAAPFIEVASRLRKWLIAGTIIYSIAVQGMAVAVDHQRYFFARGLTPFFWYDDEAYYFRESALVARPAELAELVRPSIMDSNLPFRPGPRPDSMTYAIFGPESLRELQLGAQWIKRFSVFSLPRPWPLWTLSIRNTSLQARREQLISLLLAVSALGGLLLSIGLTQENCASKHHTDRPSV